MIHVDLMLSPQFQALPKSTQLFYLACRVNSASGKARKSLALHIREDMENEAGVTDKDIQLAVSNAYDNGYFVMPALHLAKYGYTRQQGWNHMNVLQRSGFIEVVEPNAHRWKENVYMFSTNFKNPSRLETYIESMEKRKAKKKKE